MKTVLDTRILSAITAVDTDREKRASCDHQPSASDDVSVLGLFPPEAEKNRPILCLIPPMSDAVQNLVRRFRSNEEPHAGITNVVLGCHMSRPGELLVESLLALAVARVGVVGADARKELGRYCIRSLLK
jgi:hypothetical protein